MSHKGVSLARVRFGSFIGIAWFSDDGSKDFAERPLVIITGLNVVCFSSLQLRHTFEQITNEDFSCEEVCKGHHRK